MTFKIHKLPQAEKGRSFFKYEEGQLIWIGLIYEKKTQKAPDDYIKLALKRLKEARK